MKPRQSADQQGNTCIALLGAGSLGKLWGAYLPPGSACFLPRSPGKLESPNRFDLITPEGARHPRQVEACELEDIQAELVLVLTKAGDVTSALAPYVGRLPEGVPIVLFQNGLGTQDQVVQQWSNHPVLAAVTTEGANRPDHDTIVHAGRGETWIGGLNDAGHGVTDSVCALLGRSALRIHAETDIRYRLWHKLVVNAGINAFTAILDCPNGAILKSDFFLEHIDGLCQEISQIMATEMDQFLTPDEVKDRIYAVAKSTAANTSSMRSDRQRGRITEIDVINGYLVQAGARSGIATPVNRMLYESVKDITEHRTNTR